MTTIPQSAENFSLAELMRIDGKTLEERVAVFKDYAAEVRKRRVLLYRRRIVKNDGTHVVVADGDSGEHLGMVMFGSNNYLGLANHPSIEPRVAELIRDVGPGLGGPPLLNGNSVLHETLERTLAEHKGKDDALIFSSGFLANFGLGTTLFNRRSLVLFDEYSHASFIDGVLMSRTRFKSFRHNDVQDLRRLLAEASGAYAEIFVATEGVFSMDGDIGRVDEIVALKKDYRFLLVVDDAHGLGVIGENGHGVHEHFRTDGIDLIMGTFSKTLAATGGFIAASRDLVNYMRFICRTYMFSAALPPIVVAQVLAGLEVIASEKWRIRKLRENAAQLVTRLAAIGIRTHSESGIVTVLVSPELDIRALCRAIHDRGIFLNAVEYPAVPLELQRLRISLMADHTPEEIEKLVRVLGESFSSVREAQSAQPLVANPSVAT